MPRVLLLDALGTLVALQPPAPRLRRELAARFAISVSEHQAAQALAAEIRYYRAHLDLGRDDASLAALRRRCAEVLRSALPPSDELARVGTDELTSALLASLRFSAFDDAAAAIRQARGSSWRVVVASNWDVSLHHVLQRLELAQLVDGIVTSAEVGARKPSPAGVRTRTRAGPRNAGGGAPCRRQHRGGRPRRARGRDRRDPAGPARGRGGAARRAGDLEPLRACGIVTLALTHVLEALTSLQSMPSIPPPDTAINPPADSAPAPEPARDELPLPLWTAPAAILLGFAVGEFAAVVIAAIGTAGGSSFQHPSPAISIISDVAVDLAFVGAALVLRRAAGTLAAAGLRLSPDRRFAAASRRSSPPVWATTSSPGPTRRCSSCTEATSFRASSGSTGALPRWSPRQCSSA